MKTFEEDLKPKITPEFIKKLCELAEGFEASFDGYFKIHGKINAYTDEMMFALLLHRAVEGWNKKERTSQKIQHNLLSILEDRVLLFYNDNYYKKNYQPCHLTACEMAILDCLLEILK